MRTVSYSEARKNRTEVLESAVTEEAINITRRGHKTAVIISAEGIERYPTARMDDAFAAIIAFHGNELIKLADRLPYILSPRR
ncbi:type II toxin-antitoxin system Phd/YefM family antitoxin [Salmonella enterica]|uniref:type II toxin-antitoxin system Phd/YefM family antitoxin n=1 Tax=Salmonella enterica TaxID=28901 RepID=UPI00398C4990